MKHYVIERPAIPGVARLPFSDAVEAGNTVYISGRIGLDPQTRKPPADVSAEARLVMDDLRNVLLAAGLTMNHLVSVQIFAPDVAHFATFNEVYLTYFEDKLPARAFLGSGPLLFGARFEVMAVAVRA